MTYISNDQIAAYVFKPILIAFTTKNCDEKGKINWNKIVAFSSSAKA